MYQKNDELVVTITDVGTNGEGIGKVTGFTLFIKDAIIGDEVRVKIMKTKKNYAFAKLLEVITPSKHRVKPICEVARQCGGCQLQAMDYETQLQFKEAKVYNNIKRIGGLDSCQIEMHPIIASPKTLNYRNKAQFPVGKNADGNIVYGFYAGRTHSIIESNDCKLGICPDGVDVNAKVMETIKTFMEVQGIEPYDEESHSGLVRHVLIRIGEKTKQVSVCIVINGNEIPNAEYLTQRLLEIPGVCDISVNINKERNNVIMGLHTNQLYGPGYIEDYIDEVKFRISPQSFYQVNPYSTELLYRKALDYADLTGKEIIWDLYSGIGTISLFLAQDAKKVIGVEIVPDAVSDAKINAEINGIGNVEFLEGAAEDIVPKYFSENPDAEGCKPDVIVVDPPRKGCDMKLLKTMIEMNPERIVYVSCDSATLARDISLLSMSGYRMKEMTPVDMFPQTVHVETVVLMEKQ